MPIFTGSTGVPALVGHRGVRRPEVVENTPEAFALAAAEGADWVELDARRSADDVIVLYHNAYTADRVSLVSRTAAQLREEYGIFPMNEVLASLPAGVGVNVEVKNLAAEPDYDPTDALVETVVRDVHECVGDRPLMFSSFNPLTLKVLRDLAPDDPAGLITWDSFDLRKAIPVAQEYGAAVLVPRLGTPNLDAEGVAECHDAGIAVMVWTVNDVATAKALHEAGVDALCTDDPGTLRAGLAATPPA